MTINSSSIDSAVPLSQSHSGGRAIALSIALADGEWTSDASSLGEDISKASGSGSSVDATAFSGIYRTLLEKQGAPASILTGIDITIGVLSSQRQKNLDAGEIQGLLTKPTPIPLAGRTSLEALAQPHPMGRARFNPAVFASAGRLTQLETTGAASNLVVESATGAAGPGPITAPTDEGTSERKAEIEPLAPLAQLTAVPELGDALIALTTGKFLLPQLKWSRIVTLVPYTPPPKSNPTFFLVEKHVITSSLGKFGLGRTASAFSLFPGETTELTMKTWLTSDQKLTQGSSIVDSFSSASADRFNSTLESSVGRSSSIDIGSSYSNEWHAGGGFSFIVSAEAGGGETRSQSVHSGRADFANKTSAAVKEHTASANASRQTNVTQEEEIVTKSGTEQTSTRTIRNVNMRNCLNITFRELNQQYITRVHLVDLRIGFQNGRIGSWREAPLSQLRPFVAQFVAGNKVDEVCSKLIGYAAVVFDHTDTPVPVLQALTWTPGGLDVQANDAAPDSNGAFAPPSDALSYRFRRGPLGNQSDVEGVVLTESTVVMQTGSLVADALLSPGEALDQYAMERQAADSKASSLANDRTLVGIDGEKVALGRAKSVVEALDAISDPEKRVAAYSDAFRPIVVDGDSVEIDGVG